MVHTYSLIHANLFVKFPPIFLTSSNILVLFFIFAGIIKCVTLTTLYINSMWWPPNQSLGGMIHQTVFLILSALSAFNYVMGTICGPGFLPLKWEPKVCILLLFHNFSLILIFVLHLKKRTKEPKSYCSFAVFVKDLRHLGRTIAENVDGVL